MSATRRKYWDLDPSGVGERVRPDGREGSPRIRPGRLVRRPPVTQPNPRLGGAPPARSALTLRLVLVGFGLVVCGLASAAFVVVADQAVFAAIFAFFGAVALADIIVVARLKLRGEPG